MNKKIIRTVSLLLSVLMLFMLCSCSEKSDQDSDNAPAVTVSNTVATPEKTDIDLSGMAFNMLYAQLNEMKSTPADYLGKTVKIKGTFQVSHYAETNKDYYYVVGADTTACCNWNLEFILPEGTSYPEKGTTIEISGTYSTYDELDVTYYYIDADSIKTL